jgi:hypothetical protein
VKHGTPTEDKAPYPANREMGLFMFFMLGLRVSRFQNLRAVSGSKSDTPTRAKNCEAMVRKGGEKVKTKRNTGDRSQKTE